MNKTINVVLNKCFSILGNKSKSFVETNKVIGQYNLNLAITEKGQRKVTLAYKSRGAAHVMTLVGIRDNIAIEHKHGNEFTTYQLKNSVEQGCQFITEYHYNQLLK